MISAAPPSSATATELEAGQVLLRVDAFAFTANNVTYAVFGAMMRYWDFFPAQDGWGRVPVWGFADVVRSRHPAIGEGERFYGYLPSSSRISSAEISSSPLRGSRGDYRVAMRHGVSVLTRGERYPFGIILHDAE